MGKELATGLLAILWILFVFFPLSKYFYRKYKANKLAKNTPLSQEEISVNGLGLYRDSIEGVDDISNVHYLHMKNYYVKEEKGPDE